MTHSRAWNNNSPLDSEQVKFGPTAIRNLKEDFSERFGVDHIIGESIDDGAGQDGHHKQLTMKGLGVFGGGDLNAHGGTTQAPGPSMQLFTMSPNYPQDNKIELWILNSNGAGVQLTKDGIINNTLYALASSLSSSKIGYIGKSINNDVLAWDVPNLSFANKHLSFTKHSSALSMNTPTIPEDGLYMVALFQHHASYSNYSLFYDNEQIEKSKIGGFTFNFPYGLGPKFPHGLSITGGLYTGGGSNLLSAKKLCHELDIIGSPTFYYTRYHPWIILKDPFDPYVHLASILPVDMTPMYFWSGYLDEGDVISFIYQIEFHGTPYYMIDSGSLVQDHYLIIYKVD